MRRVWIAVLSMVMSAASICLTAARHWESFDDHYFAARVAVGGTGTGGYITNYTENGTNFTAHIFTNVGETNFVVSGGSLDCEVLKVDGGGGGGGNHGGGGGAGLVVYTQINLTAGDYPVTIGDGGLGNSASGGGTSGSNTTFNSLPSAGGGCGGSFSAAIEPADGGSGAGGTAMNSYNIEDYTFGSATSAVGFGNDGGAGWSYQKTGDGVIDDHRGGGGGGAGGPGTNATLTITGDGGPGLQYSISGVARYYGGGGGGCGSWYGGATAGAGGKGGGGAGATGNSVGTAGTANTGGGGGGGRNNAGGKGGSGILVIRYVTPE